MKEESNIFMRLSRQRGLFARCVVVHLQTQQQINRGWEVLLLYTKILLKKALKQCFKYFFHKSLY